LRELVSETTLASEPAAVADATLTDCAAGGATGGVVCPELAQPTTPSATAKHRARRLRAWAMNREMLPSVPMTDENG
jgi:hypothetical protein